MEKALLFLAIVMMAMAAPVHAKDWYPVPLFIFFLPVSAKSSIFALCFDMKTCR